MYDKHQFVVYFVHTNDIRIKFPVRQTVETELHTIFVFYFYFGKEREILTHICKPVDQGGDIKIHMSPSAFRLTESIFGYSISFHCMHQHFGSLVRCDPSPVNNNFNQSNNCCGTYIYSKYSLTLDCFIQGCFICR